MPKVLAVKLRWKSNTRPRGVPFDTVDMLIQAGTIVHDAVSIAPVQLVSTVIVSVLKTIQAMRQNRGDCLDLGQCLVDIHNLITDVLKEYSSLPSSFILRCNEFLRSLLQLSDDVKDIARIGPIRAFLNSSRIKNEISRHRQILQEWKTNFMLRTVLEIRLFVEKRMPREIGYPWEHGKRLHLVDAMNIKLDLPMELCNSWDDFNDLIKFIFRKRRGKRYIERGDYDLTDQQQHEVLNSSNWDARARYSIAMDVILRSTVNSRDDNHQPCPACNQMCTIRSSSEESQCPACLCTFRMSEIAISLVRTESTDHPANTSSHLVSFNRQNVQQHRRSVSETTETQNEISSSAITRRAQSPLLEPDDIQYFRRIHVMIDKILVAPERNYSRLPPKGVSESPAGRPANFKWVRGELIAKGTYARVYLAINATVGEMIVVKQVEIWRTPSDESEARQREVIQALRLESEILKDLDHPNIIQYLGFEETPTNLNLFLEYVPGGSIGSCLAKHGRFDEEVTKSFTAQILDGLEYLHSNGIMHRDLKGDNIVVDQSGVCKILDFGISRRIKGAMSGAFQISDVSEQSAEHSAEYTAMRGTIFWMAPEVVNPQGNGYNPKVDIWNIGCVVLEMWSGMRPWQGEKAVSVLLKLFRTKLAPPVPEDVTLSELGEDFRRNCFAINPDERPTAAELRKHKYLGLRPGWVFTGFK